MLGEIFYSLSLSLSLIMDDFSLQKHNNMQVHVCGQDILALDA